MLEYFEDAMRAPWSPPALMTNPFFRATGQLLFSWSPVGVTLEALNAYDKLKLGDTGLRVYQMLVRPIAPDNSGLSLAGRCHLLLEMDKVSDV